MIRTMNCNKEEKEKLAKKERKKKNYKVTEDLSFSVEIREKEILNRKMHNRGHCKKKQKQKRMNRLRLKNQ